MSKGATMTADSGPILATVLGTPAGPISLLARADTLIAAGFTADPAGLHARLHRSLRPLELAVARPGELSWLVKPVLGYFDGDLTALDMLPVHQPGTAGRQRLWERMRAIPAGRTVSYAGLAASAELPAAAARAAGAACAANLVAPVVPCHRVLRADGSLGGYYYGLACKRWLLRHEGALPPR
jgi:methylated-DNA-[protein]-cysteine S-methyltransferase